MTQAKDSWRLVIAVSIANTIGLSPSSVTAFLVGGAMDDLGFTAVQAGTLATVEMTTIAVTSMLIAPSMPRFSVVRLAMLGVVIGGLAQLGSAQLDVYSSLIGARFFCGVGSGLVLAAASATAAAAADPDRIYGYAIAGFMGLLAILSSTLAPIIAAKGMFGGYTTIGLVYLVLAPCLLWLGRGRRKLTIPSTETPSLPRGMIVLLMTIMVMFGLGPGPVWSFMERIGVDLGIDATNVGRIYFLGIMFGLVSSLLAGKLGTRWGRVLPLSIAMITLGFACFGFPLVSGTAGYTTMMVLFWLSYMFVNVLLFATVAVFDPSGRVGSAGVGAFMFVLGLGPTLGGVLVTHGSYEATGWFAVLICGLCSLLIVMIRAPLSRLGLQQARHFPDR